MSDQGLSIFDDPEETPAEEAAEDQPTQVVEAQDKGSRQARSSSQRPARGASTRRAVPPT